MITIAANALSSTILNNQNSRNSERLAVIEAQLSEQGKGADASRQATKDERAFAFSIIEKELAKSSDMAARAGMLLFLVRSGILNSLNRNELEKTNADPSSAGIPKTLGFFRRPNYNLDLPAAIAGQTEAAKLLLKIAIQEINRNVEEHVSFDDVKKYWSAVSDFPIEKVTPDDAWGGAFAAWVIAASGNPDRIVLSADSAKIWRSASDKGITFGPHERSVLGGDLVFIARSNGKIVAGVVYSAEGRRLRYIGGNIGLLNQLCRRPIPAELCGSKPEGLQKAGEAVFDLGESFIQRKLFA
jgi:hypothetical protein